MLTDIHKLLDAELKLVTGMPDIYTENLPAANQNAGTKWCRTTMLPARTDVVSIGLAYQERYQGLFQVDLFYPRDRGFSLASTQADLVIAYFYPGYRVQAVTGFWLLIEQSWRLPATTFNNAFYNPAVQVRWSVYQ
jgi:hypothetical protein